MTRKNEGALVFFLLSMVLVLPFAAWYGFVVSTLWRWFVVPLGVVHVGVWEAAGVFLLVRLLTFDSTLDRDDERTPAEKFSAAVFIALILPAVSLAFGAIYHAFA